MDLDLSPPAWIFVARRTFFLFFSFPSKGTSISRIFRGARGNVELKTVLERWFTLFRRHGLLLRPPGHLMSNPAHLPHRLWLCTPLSSGWLDSLGEWQQQTHPRGCPRCPYCWLLLSPDTTFYTRAKCCEEASLKTEHHRGSKCYHDRWDK